MQNTILETILDEIHDSSNGNLKTVEVLAKELIIVNVDTFLFKAIQEIIISASNNGTFVEPQHAPTGSNGKIRIKQFSRSEVEFVIVPQQKHYSFQISEIKK